MSEEPFPGELEELRIRLREAEETLEAIRSGAVDAIVVSGKTGDQVYTLQSADNSYRLLVESINEGTVTISADGTILYSNRQFADMLGSPLEKIIGTSLPDLIAREDRHLVTEALRSRPETASRFQLLLDSPEGGKIPVQITLGRADATSAGSMTAVITNLSEQLRYREMVREENLSRTIMENSPEGIAVCDVNGMVIRASRALGRYCDKSVLMEPFDRLFFITIPVANGKAGLFSAGDVLAGKMIQGIESRLDGPGGGHYEIILNAVPLRGDENAIIGCLITITDITQRKKAETVLQERTQQLQDANRELEGFSYSVSHDLKAPLRAVDGYSRMVLKKFGGELSEEAARMLGVIRDSTGRMNVLIDDLLSFSRVLRSDMAVAEIDMEQCAREVWDEIRAVYPERELEIRIAGLLPGFGDRSLIRQVLFNLLSNAVKFTKCRKPAVVEMSSRLENGSIVYCIRDNGVGFDMAYYHKLFGVFQRLHSQAEYEGTGVGLAIVQRIVQRHGGRVWAEGEVDKGAAFYFSLPSRQG